MTAKLEWAPASCTRFVFSLASVNLCCLRVETSFVPVLRKSILVSRGKHIEEEFGLRMLESV